MSTKQTVHPHLNLYKLRQYWLIYLILLLCFDHFHLFLFVLSGWKKMKQKRTLNMQVKVILRKTQQGHSLSKELKDKYETRIHNSLQLDCWIAIIVVSIVFPACHVFKSYWVEPFCCCWDGEEEEEGGEVRWRSKHEASYSIREKKVCNIFIIFY